MFSASTYKARRDTLRARMGSGIVLFLGNDDAPMNYRANTYHFRQDSNFLYYFGIDRPGLIGLMDLDAGEDMIYGNELTMDDIVWTGNQPTLQAKAAAAGVHKIAEPTALAAVLGQALQQGRKIHFTPPYRSANAIKLHTWLDIAPQNAGDHSSPELVQAIVAQRSYKTEEEVTEIEKAVRLTNQMHLTAMRATRPGWTEADVVGDIMQVVGAADSHTSFPIIATVDGNILHNHHHGNTLKSGDLMLVDCGGESPMHYAGDMTRTYPVDPQFSSRQREVYAIACDAQIKACAALRPGIDYRDVHVLSARIIAEGMKSLGLMKGDTDAAVAAGAHALFFQHGLGHMMGLDVHDMEDLGENNVGYGEGMERSTQFGLAFLRLGRKLEPGFVVTVEPGIYFIPELIDMWKAENKHADFINYDRVETFKDFGGIRIEDDYLITADGARLLGDPIPKTIEDLENYRS